MGKSWLACVSVSCLSPGKDKKHQKEEKEKKKLYEKQKSRESIEFSIEETPPPSSSVSQPSPPLPDFSPQPSLPPPSPLLTSSSYKGYVGDSKEARNTRQALVLASVVAEEAAFVAANAAAEVMRLATSTHQIVESKEDVAAIKIQSLYRCYKARRALRVLQGMARLQALLQGKYVKRQMNAMLSSMQTLTRLQIQIHERRSRLSEENKDRHRLIQQKSHQKEQQHQQNHSLVIAGDFDSSNKSKKQVEAKIANRKEASVRRERALAYAYSHQQTWRNSTKLPHQTLMDANTPHWGWSWLERWMDSRPWDPQSNDDQAFHKRDEHSTKASPARSNKTLKSSSSQKSIQWPTNNESQKVEGSNRRHSIGGGSSTSVNDEESIGSSSSRRSSLGNTASASKPVKKPKASVGPKGNLGNTESSKSKASVGAKGNLGNTQYVQKKKVVSDHNKKPPQVVLPKKRLSSSTSKKLLDSDKTVTTGEKKRRNGTST